MVQDLLAHRALCTYPTEQHVLLAHHALPKGMHFLCRLCEYTEVAAEGCHEVTKAAALNALLLADLGTKVGGTDTVEDRDTLNESTNHARLSNLFSYLTSRVARHKVRHYTDGTVGETTAQTILELIGRHDDVWLV